MQDGYGPGGSRWNDPRERMTSPPEPYKYQPRFPPNLDAQRQLQHQGYNRHGGWDPRRWWDSAGGSGYGRAPTAEPRALHENFYISETSSWQQHCHQRTPTHGPPMVDPGPMIVRHPWSVASTAPGPPGLVLPPHPVNLGYIQDDISRPHHLVEQPSEYQRGRYPLPYPPQYEVYRPMMAPTSFSGQDSPSKRYYESFRFSAGGPQHPPPVVKDPRYSAVYTYQGRSSSLTSPAESRTPQWASNSSVPGDQSSEKRRTSQSPTSSTRIKTDGAHEPGHYCKIDGCHADISREIFYYKKRRMCRSCVAADAVIVDGASMRFCQQCSLLHNLSDFDGSRRSCRQKLEKHKLKVRKSRNKKAASAAATAESGEAG